MKRPKQHQIDDMTCRQFEECIPKHWVISISTQDYGTDREVEIFVEQPENKPALSTGQTFKVQIKGTENPVLSDDGKFVKFQLAIDSANYLCTELNVPAFFVLADVKNKTTWWYAIQVDGNLLRRLKLAREKNQNTIHLDIPSENILPETLKGLVRKLEDIRLYKACGSLIDIPNGSFADLPLDIEEISELERKFTDKVFAAKIARYWENKDLDSIEKTSKEAIVNSNNSISTKVSAILCVEKVSETKTIGSFALPGQLDQIYINTAITLKKITKGESKSWRLFSAIAWRAARLRIACSDDFSLYMNRLIHKANDDDLELDYICSTVLDLARQRTFQQVLQRYNQCLRLLNLVLNRREYWMVPHAVLRIAQSLPPVFMRLWEEHLDETARLFRENVKELINISVNISCALSKWDDMGQLVYSLFAINSQNNKKHYQETWDWAHKTLDKITDKSLGQELLQQLESICQRFDPSKNKVEVQEPDIPGEEEYNVYTQMARAVGINLDDPNDDIAKVVRIGLQDLNPERVLKKCEYLFAYTGHYGIIAEMLKLYTAGSKYLRCLKKDIAFSGISLDVIYNIMSQQYCSNCKDCLPRPDNWKWTRSWHNKESEKEIHRKFRETF